VEADGQTDGHGRLQYLPANVVDNKIKQMMPEKIYSSIYFIFFTCGGGLTACMEVASA